MRCFAAGLLFVFFFCADVWGQATLAPRSSSWQSTARITGLIEPHDPFLRYTTSRENEDLIRIRQNNERFWHALRDSLNDAMRDGLVQAYSVRPSQRAGMQRIFVRDEPLPYEELIATLDRNLETVASLRTGEVIFIPSRGDVFNLRNFVEDNETYYSHLAAISLFEFEFEVLIDENGMTVKPNQLIFGTALYPGRITYDNNPNDFFSDVENGLAFLIDFNDETTKDFFFSRGIGRSASQGMTSFYDLLMSFRYPHFFYSIDGIELARAMDPPFEYELGFIREEVQTQLFSIMMEFTYGEIPDILRRNRP
ncbi:MAG: hypothetical protein LAT75_12230 [Candidatus Cyclonatronum sp.]|uniref:hypothetical protein n=1 Tax=Cyclonatronum sp. TaxID=3024185 RepID=UPI0025C5CD9A|nr:hypothetical protein [Cyclonatronum sp.]MCC5934936.1 hypothetical protein [Balneolales bacterium]MCH8487627.1 hypothetical protein [Cyclonatronum sp.]